MTAFGGRGYKNVEGVALASRGRIVAAGFAAGGNRTGVVRYLPGGALDRSFGNGGKVLTAFRGGNLAARDVVVDRHNRSVVAGEAWRHPKRWYGLGIALAAPRRTPGQILLRQWDLGAPGRALMVPTELAFGKGGRIVVVGYVSDPPSDVFVARFLPDGRLDRSFSGNGYRVMRVGGGEASRSVAIDREGRIVIGTSAGIPGEEKVVFFLVIRLRSNGTLDRTFSGDGQVKTPVYEGRTRLSDVTVDPHDRIVALGYSSHESSGSATRRAGGSTAPSRGTEDEGLFLAAGACRRVRGSAGRIVVSGDSEFDYGGAEMTVARVRANGRLDGRFHHGIVFVNGLAGTSDHIIDRRNRIVVGGGVGRFHFAVARLLNP